MRFKTILATLSCACLVACGGANTDSQPTAKPHAFASTAAQAPQSAPEYAFVALPGKRNDYAITLSNAGYEVLYLPGPDGSQTFSGAPSLRFDDMTVNLGIGAQSQAIAPADLKLLIELYIAFFNRLPEADGLSFWIGRFMGGMPLAEIADHFFEAAAGYQGLTGYYREMTHTEFVKLIYRNVLGRDGATAPSSSEVQWWAGRLSSGSASRGLLVRTMLESAHSFAGHATYGWVSDFLDNKAIVGRYFAVQQGLGYSTPEMSIQSTMQFAAAITPTSTAAAIAAIGMRDTHFDLVTLPITPPPPQPPPGVPVVQKAVAFQMDAAHSGVASFGQPLHFRPGPTWKRSFASGVSYPLIADGRVIVSVGGPSFGENGTWVVAFDLANGKLLWGPVTIPGHGLWSAQAYDNGTVYVANTIGQLLSLDAATGQVNWLTTISPAYDMQSMASITAANGIVYVTQYQAGGIAFDPLFGVYAIDGKSGARLWQNEVYSSGGPTVAAGRVFISHPCTVQTFSAQTGVRGWSSNSGCAGGGGRIPVYANGSLYVRLYDMMDDSASVILDATTGVQTGTFRSNMIPAVNSTTLFSIDTVWGGYQKTGDLVATNLQTGQSRWRFSGDGFLTGGPLVIDNTVIVGSQPGRLYALDTATGAVRWEIATGAAQVTGADDEHNASQPLSGFAAGEGYLVTPLGITLAAWRIVAGPATSTVAQPAKPPAGTSAPGTWANCAVPFVQTQISRTSFQIANICEGPISLSYRSSPAGGGATRTIRMEPLEIRFSAIEGALSWASCPAASKAVNSSGGSWAGGRYFCR